MLTFQKRSHASTLSIWTKKIQAKSEEWTTQTAINCVTLSLQSFGTRDYSSLSYANVYVLLYRYCFVFLLYLRAIFQVQAPGGLYLKGRFNGGFFALGVWGAYIWRSLCREGLIFETLRYIFSKKKDNNNNRTNNCSKQKLDENWARL